MDYKVKDCVLGSVLSDVREIAEAEIPWERLKNKSILITGGGGFIGGYLTLALLLRNDRYGDNIHVTALVRSRERAEQKFGRLLVREDFSLCVQDVNKPIQTDRADFVIHAASQASNIQFETDPVGTISANLAGTQNVLEFAKKSEAEATLIVSSLKVYGTLYGEENGITEDDCGYLDFTSYKNCYAMGKRAAETLAACYCREFGMNVKLARPAYIYGAASLDDDRVWAQFIANIVKKQDILLKSSGAARRSFCYVTDTATALLTILLKGENAVPYNIAFEQSDTTIRGFAKTACEAFPERNISLRFANPEDEKEPEELVTPLRQVPEILDSTRLKSLGWQPKVPLAEGIRRAVGVLEEQTKN